MSSAAIFFGALTVKHHGTADSEIDLSLSCLMKQYSASFYSFRGGVSI